MSGLRVDLVCVDEGGWEARSNIGGATGFGKTVIAALEDLLSDLKSERDRAVDEALATARESGTVEP